MINLMLGQPGGGKTYESVAFHIIPAVVEQGRKVITNLPLDLSTWERYWPGCTKLIDIREPLVVDGAVVRPFSRAEHYGDPWRHPDTGVGPLYVIDECHLAIPARGPDPREQVRVEEWFSLHRHELADVLLITQSYGKISRAIRDLVQIVYRCKKATAFGFSNHYIRKVQDGLRGEVVNTTERKYEKKYFPLYKSHTKSSKAAEELTANDIVPIWKRWPFKGAAIMFLIFAGIVTYQLNRDDKKAPPVARAQPVQKAEPQPIAQAQQVPSQPVEVAQPRGPERQIHPYQGYDLFLSAVIQGQRTNSDGVSEPYMVGYLTVTQNGQAIRQVSFSDLIGAGYSITYESPTVIGLEYKGHDLGYVISALPAVSLASKTPDKAAGG
ncbi:zonular occludens toxin domain-containing protein [Stutzerimonas stutzeri]|uniref:zonular occludens toxin domain-containing protein n=1 Tax=Stutzerimonas stutzeri TaxID=316 RepID=UPI001BCF5C81|nr:zonular occludens toxin domain-containing protein [Stutzerimonas stutzeri]